MKFKISNAVFKKFPSLNIGIIIGRDIDNTKTNPEIESLLRESESNIQRSFQVKTFKEHPKIVSLQEAHRAFGNNPNKFPPSHQALTKRILKGNKLPSINPIVDIYNIISLRYIVPAGGEDLDACMGDIQLVFADGTEEFIPLGEQENNPPTKGEAVYKDDKGVICRKLDWREGDRTKLTEKTKNAVLVIEAFPPVTREELQNALTEMQDLVQKYCKGSLQIHILNAEHHEVIML